MNRAVFLDRDGTINVDKGYLYKKEEFEFIPGVLEGLKLLQDAGFILIIITNQSGVARGYYTEEDLICLNRWMQEYLEERNIIISKIYYCPHLPEAKIEKYRVSCNCRKPNTGLFYQAVKDFNIQLDKSYVIGDRLRDCSICRHCNCNGFVIGDTEDNQIISGIKEHKYANIEYVPSLLEAARIISMRA